MRVRTRTAPELNPFGWLIAALLLVAFSGGTAAQSSGCLDQLIGKIASDVGAGPGYTVKVQAGTVQSWMYDECKWVIGTYKGAAVGASAQDPSPNVNLWPEGIDSQFGGSANLCTPDFLAKAFGVLAHELLHFLCPPHSDKGVPPGEQFDLTKPPSVPPTPPDCNDINYAVMSAQEVCDQIGAVAACCANPECPGLKDTR